jgi:ketosteroid isomerase-like protein
MNKQLSILFALMLVLAISAHAQKGINGLINTEKSFAAQATQTNTRDAFLHYMDSADAVVFNGGRILNAYTTWHNALPNNNKLIWQPVFAGISQSGELGFTTGPWQFKKATAQTVLATGSYTTVWHLDAKGTWKFLVDIGTDGGVQPQATDSVKKWVGKTIDDMDTRDALTIDRVFIQQYASAKNDAFTGVVTADTWLNQPGQAFVTGLPNVTAAIQQIPAGLSFEPVGGAVSASGDMVYVYGSVRHEAKIANYLRIWQKTNGKFNILLQVLQW